MRDNLISTILINNMVYGKNPWMWLLCALVFLAIGYAIGYAVCNQHKSNKAKYGSPDICGVLGHPCPPGTYCVDGKCIA